MSVGGTESMTFQATAPQVLAALKHAADRTGLQFLSGDAATGTYVYTSGMVVLAAGEKVTVRITPFTNGTAEVTFSSDVQFGIQGAVSRTHPTAERFAQELGVLLPRIG